jgi:hypothetical protein
MAVATDVPVPDDVIRLLRATEGILDVHRVHGEGLAER